MNDGLSEENLEESYDDYLLLISKLVDAIAEMKAIIVALRQEVNLLDPDKPYENELYSDINPCFYDTSIAKKFSKLFSKLL